MTDTVTVVADSLLVTLIERVDAVGAVAKPGDPMAMLLQIEAL